MFRVYVNGFEICAALEPGFGDFGLKGLGVGGLGFRE